MVEGTIKDFIKKDERLVELGIKGFKYKLPNANDELEWLPEYLERDENGRTKTNMKKLRKCKLNNLIDVPWSKEVISEMIDKDKGWPELNVDEREELMGQLRPTTFSEVISEMEKAEQKNFDKKKV